MTSFSQKISEIYGNSKFWRFDVVLKLDIEVKNWWTYTKQLSPFRGRSTVWWCSKTFFLLIPL